ncbi:cupin domain-containing protein [Pseudoalteromonas luteoviolacea]|uniref:ChrR-like cupin domain-containing protein n=1 Tax=Pseudoalteromonas luteoviolacea H33 TaxID=1365251 RepID=A0A166ZR07_9GAMM|nr:cupin domain-containing protein [Pseudoalteromonas luteoviolacea]KZN44571.1 hypothetical protein N476_06110 [Pseudoalteromonas luteoviolacea H33]KZN75373.1 hypothetical protein N477_19120 [Pseudoalteromonas luteoviolacea H33-S]MBQ4879592.1 cupin domain-containing protein [Pseudoalteromonas luteoviolacea]MBQ4908725.1 cupin domain-containing protein [Pseudoalteromonas luteoviolacea]MCF6441374.1 cupin domain-containing protein [Pseudoalteromonas luteoviolacea]
MESILDVIKQEWEQPKGFDPGIEQIVVNDTLDETNKKGIRTRFVRFAPGAKTQVKFIHDYHEEVYLVQGDQILLDEGELQPLQAYQQGHYFTRPAGTFHGPFSSNSGCILLEVHYYNK